ncbi:MAG: LEA type 2 family protein [Phycisphaeraceae bacterium]|nr:LEA type 2 family protein [Phycisphaeraceae bacterium]
MASILILCMLTLTGCQTMQDLLQAMPKPTAEIQSLSLGNINLKNSTVNIAIKVNNPYSVSIPNLNLDYALKTQGIDFISGMVSSDTAIQARQSSTINIPVKVSYASLLKLAQTVRPGQVIAYDAHVKLSTHVPGVGPLSLPMHKQGQLPVPMIPKVTISQVDWGNISLTNTNAVIHLNVTNLNAFTVGMKQLDYNFSIGGQSVFNSKITTPRQFETNKMQTLQIPISFKATRLGFGILNMIRNKKASYSMSGKLDAQTPYGPITFPFSSHH